MYVRRVWGAGMEALAVFKRREKAGEIRQVKSWHGARNKESEKKQNGSERTAQGFPPNKAERLKRGRGISHQGPLHLTPGRGCVAVGVVGGGDDDGSTGAGGAALTSPLIATVTCVPPRIHLVTIIITKSSVAATSCG